MFEAVPTEVSPILAHCGFSLPALVNVKGTTTIVYMIMMAKPQPSLPSLKEFNF